MLASVQQKGPLNETTEMSVLVVVVDVVDVRVDIGVVVIVGRGKLEVQ